MLYITKVQLEKTFAEQINYASFFALHYLSCFAVYHCHMTGIQLQPFFHICAEATYCFKHWWMMVVKWKVFH